MNQFLLKPTLGSMALTRIENGYKKRGQNAALFAALPPAARHNPITVQYDEQPRASELALEEG